MVTHNKVTAGSGIKKIQVLKQLPKMSFKENDTHVEIYFL